MAFICLVLTTKCVLGDICFGCFQYLKDKNHLERLGDFCFLTYLNLLKMDSKLDPKYTVCIETPRMWLCLPHTDDAALYASFMNTTDAHTFLAAHNFMSIENEIEWVNRVNNSSTDIVLSLIPKDLGEVIGVMGIHSINHVHQTCRTGANIGNAKYRDKGFGTEAKMHMLKHAFHTLNMRKVSSAVHSNNPRSLKALKKAGYKVVGTQKEQIFRMGEYVDLHIVEVFRSDWEIVFQEWKQKHEY